MINWFEWCCCTKKIIDWILKVVDGGLHKLSWVSSKLVDSRSVTFPIHLSPILLANLGLKLITLPISPSFRHQFTSKSYHISNLTLNLTSAIWPQQFQWFQSVFLQDIDDSLAIQDAYRAFRSKPAKKIILFTFVHVHMRILNQKWEAWHVVESLFDSVLIETQLAYNRLIEPSNHQIW